MESLKAVGCEMLEISSLEGVPLLCPKTEYTTKINGSSLEAVWYYRKLCVSSQLRLGRNMVDAG